MSVLAAYNIGVQRLEGAHGKSEALVYPNSRMHSQSNLAVRSDRLTKSNHLKMASPLGNEILNMCRKAEEVLTKFYTTEDALSQYLIILSLTSDMLLVFGTQQYETLRLIHQACEEGFTGASDLLDIYKISKMAITT